MIIDSQKRSTWYEGPHGNIETATLAPFTVETFDPRVRESLIFGAVLSYAQANVRGCTFYPPELEPDVSSSDTWALLGVQIDDGLFHTGQWNGAGSVQVLVKTRSDADDIYAGKDIADALTVAFARAGLTVTDGNYQGYLTFGEGDSWAQGESDGVIAHQWDARFQIMQLR